MAEIEKESDTSPGHGNIEVKLSVPTWPLACAIVIGVLIFSAPRLRQCVQTNADQDAKRYLTTTHRWDGGGCH